MNSPRILILDIETSPQIVYTFGINDQFIGLPQIIEESYILSFAAKWHGDPEDKVVYMDQRKAKNIANNKKLLWKIRNMMDKADIVLGQNSKRFDVKRLNAEFELNKIPAPSSYRQLDTLTIAKKNFALPSYKLEYMTKRFCKKNKKSSHKKFPGLDLWKECLAGNIEAWNEMRVYNIKDVLATEELFNIFAKWDTSINFSVYNEVNTCSCGSTEFKKNGFRWTNSGQYQRYKCSGCHRETSGKVNLLSKERKASLKK